MNVNPFTVRGILLISALGVHLLAYRIGCLQAQDFSTIAQALIQSWEDLTPQERARALKNYHRFQQLPPDKQRTLQEKYDRWQKLSPQEQERIRRNYERYRKMDATEKKEFQRKYQQWRNQQR